MADISANVGELIARVGQRWQRLAGQALRPTGLTYPQFLLVAALARSPGFTQAAVAQLAGIDAMTASVALRNLERRRLVARRTSADDGRAKLLSLTERGAAAVGQAQQLIAAAEAEFFAGVGAARGELSAVLAALLGQRARVRVAMGRGGG